MSLLKQVRQFKPFRNFVRQSFNGSVTLLIAFITYKQGNVPADFAWLLPFVFAAINNLTKYVNNTYFGDLGVVK